MAFLAGAFVGVWVLTRILGRFAFRHLTGTRKAWTVAIVAYVLAGGLASLGMADGGAPPFAQAFGAYLLPSAFWLAVDLLRIRRTEKDVVMNATP